MSGLVVTQIFGQQAQLNVTQSDGTIELKNISTINNYNDVFAGTLLLIQVNIRTFLAEAHPEHAWLNNAVISLQHSAFWCRQTGH